MIYLETMNLFLTGITGLPDIAQLNAEVGGMLYFAGNSLLVNRSCMIGGTGFKGGAIFVTAYASDITQKFLVTESYFKGNIRCNKS